MESFDIACQRILFAIILLFLFLGGWKIVGYLILLLIGHILGLPVWGIRVLIKKTFGHDILGENAPSFYEGDDEYGIFLHAVVGLFSGFCIYILILIIPLLPWIFVGIIILSLILLIGYFTFSLISKIFKNKNKPNKIISAIVGDIILALVILIGYNLFYTVVESIEIIHEICK